MLQEDVVSVGNSTHGYRVEKGALGWLVFIWENGVRRNKIVPYEMFPEMKNFEVSMSFDMGTYVTTVGAIVAHFAIYGRK